MVFKKFFQMSVLSGACLSLAFASVAQAQDKIEIGLITKSNIDPFFAKMKEGAEAKARELGVELRSFAGRYDGDNETQVSAIETLMAAGVKGIMIAPNDTKAIVPAIEKARAAGIFVIALDTQVEPADAVDITIGTDNREAGRLIGRWAAGTLGAAAADAKIAFINSHETQPTVDYQRDQGFMEGFGIDVKNPNRYGDEDDPRIVGHQWSRGIEEGGRTAMELLLQREPGINVVYNINELAAAGAYAAIKAAKRENDILITAIDGGCPGVRNVAAGIIGATSQQYPLLMASLGVEALVKYVRTGEKPQTSEGLDFLHTGVTLITDHPVEGVPSITSEEGLKLCWG